MQHTERAYIEAGRRYERATTPAASTAAAQVLRNMIESEHIDDRAEARHLIEQGRQEARQTA